MIERDIWKKAWSILDATEKRGAWKLLGFVIVAAFFETIMIGSVLPFLRVLAEPEVVQSSHWLSWAYENLGFGNTHAFIFALGGTSLLMILTSNAVQIVKTYKMTRFLTMCMHSLSMRLLANYLRQPYEYFLNRETAKMGRNILGECGQVVSRFFQPTLDMIASALTSVMIVALLLLVNPLITVASFLVFAGIYSAVFLFIRGRVRRAGEERLGGNTGRFRIATESLSAIKDLKVSGREGTYLKRFEEASLLSAKGQIFARVYSEIPRYFLQAVAFGGVIILCLVLLTGAEGQSTRKLAEILPTLGVFAFAVQRLMPALQNVYAAATQLRFASAGVEALHADMQGYAGDHHIPLSVPAKTGLRQRLDLDLVTYRYPDSERGLFDLSLTIQQGEKVGIVGSTGSGKTTFADILLGLLIPQEGRILVDGNPIDENNLRAWQQTVGYVPQNLFLSDASIAQNIAFGVLADQIDIARIEAAAKLAQLDQFVKDDLELGYDTVIGERGIRLSGGQRQRIGIARALYNDADLILFDEATSALDNKTERQVMESIEALPGDKTILMIAHRLSTVRICDRIIVLDKGHLSDVGSWDDLMARSEIFQNLVQMVEVE
jgi:ABC-type multidrug transport system fused ATPase/permease subunit